MTVRKMTRSTGVVRESPTIIYGQPVRGPHSVAVQFSVWTAQTPTVTASGGGGRGDLPYIAVTVGHLLVYVYDRAALDAHLRAWTDAAGYNNRLRLPSVVALRDNPTSSTDSGVVEARSGQDLSVVANVIGRQRCSVTGEPGGDGERAIRVIVGAVTVRVHTSTALASFVRAWTRAETLAGLFALVPDDDDA